MLRRIVFGILAGALSATTAFAQAAPANPAPPKSPYETLTGGMKRVEGMWTLYHKDQQLLVDISPA